MTEKDLYEYLRRKKKKEIAFWKMREFKQKVYEPVSQVINGMPHSGRAESDTMAEAIQRLDELQKAYCSAVWDEMIAEDDLNELELYLTVEEQEYVKLKYREGFSFRYIGSEMHVSNSTQARIRKSVLDKAAKLL